MNLNRDKIDLKGQAIRFEEPDTKGKEAKGNRVR
jgi:hypothetical protein